MKVPKELSKDSRKIWRSICKTWDLNESGQLLLKTALECRDEYQKARSQLEIEGYVIKNPRTGLLKKHPLLEVLKLARSQFLQAWRGLNLDLPPPDGG